MIQRNGLCAKNRHGNLSIPDVLLILDAAIDREQDIEICIFRGVEQFAILEPAKPSTTTA